MSNSYQSFEVEQDNLSSETFNLLLEYGFHFLQDYYNKQRISISDALNLSFKYPVDLKELEKLGILTVTYCMIKKFRSGLDQIDERITEKILEELIKKMNQINYDKLD